MATLDVGLEAEHLAMRLLKTEAGYSNSEAFLRSPMADLCRSYSGGSPLVLLTADATLARCGATVRVC